VETGEYAAEFGPDPGVVRLAGGNRRGQASGVVEHGFEHVAADGRPPLASALLHVELRELSPGRRTHVVRALEEQPDSAFSSATVAASSVSASKYRARRSFAVVAAG